MTVETSRKPLRLADYYAWHTLEGLAISPDGRLAAYVQRGARKAKNDHYTNLWLVETDGRTEPHRLTRALSRDSAPAFSPDGRYLAVLSTRETELEISEAEPTDEKNGKAKSDKPKAQIWVFDLLRGGEPRQVTTLAEGASAFNWSPDSARLVVAARTPSDVQKKYLEAIRGDEHGPIQLRRMQHKRDGVGFLDEVQTHLHVVDVATRVARQLTDGPCSETEPRWSPDGQWIGFASNRTGFADANHRTDLWLIRPDGSACRRLTFGDVGAYGLRWSPDSKQIAFITGLEPEHAYKLRHILLVSVADAKPVADLAACVGEGWSAIGGIIPDIEPGAAVDRAENARRYPVPVAKTPCRVLTASLDRIMMGAPIWVDADTIIIQAGDRGQTRLLQVGVNGQCQFIYPTDRFSEVGAVASAAGRLVITLDSAQTGPDLYALPVAHPAGADPVRLTAINAGLVGDRTLARYERVEFTGSNGDTVEALLTIPPGWTPAAGPAPVVLSIHGGPMSYDHTAFHFLRQYWAGMGYLVVMVNYHGSISYGEAFCESIRGKWGPTEHGDLEAALDHLVAKGWADPKRLFVNGFSQGGIMTNWAVGHTDRFRAAVSEHGMWNYLMSYGTDDCHLWWQDDMGVPWQNSEVYARTSPASGLTSIKTPTLIMAGEHDWRCPLIESEQMYMGLKKRGVPTELVVYQGENHAVSKPRRMIDRIRRICGWFADYGGIALDDETAEGYPGLE